MKYRHITYKEKFDFDTGNVEVLTPCPFGTGRRVASNDCHQCKYFISLYQAGAVQCANPIQFNEEPTQLDLFTNTG